MNPPALIRFREGQTANSIDRNEIVCDYDAAGELLSIEIMVPFTMTAGLDANPVAEVRKPKRLQPGRYDGDTIE